tara:strand:+ start:13030 stop:13422 length:393 start_codon:yes stop_codon:yes gene_type:complete
VSVEVEIRAKEKVVVACLKGQMTAEELAVGYARIFEDPAFEINMAALWDISGLNLTRIEISEIRALPKLLGQYSTRRGAQYRAAIVTNRVADFQLLRMYAALLKLIGSFRMKVFTNHEDALAWLALQKDE